MCATELHERNALISLEGLKTEVRRTASYESPPSQASDSRNRTMQSTNSRRYATIQRGVTLGPLRNRRVSKTDA
jgi:hypothetical protein